MADLEIRGLVKAFDGQPVLRGVNLTVAAGTLVAILGPSGSGKTTLLRLIAGFERADAGTIAFGDELLSGPALHLAPERRRIGYMAQEGALFPHLRVADNVLFGLPRRVRRERERASELLELAGLSAAYGERWPHELSGGEQSRVALARALAPSPRLVLLDEPFAALDAALRVETRQAVAAALERAGTTGVLVTHDQAEALSMGHEVAVLREGRLVQVAQPEVLYRHPVDVELGHFIGEAVVLKGFASAGSVTCSLGRLGLGPAMPEGPVEVLLRPEQVRLIPVERANGVRAKVTGVTFYGHDASVLLELADAKEPRQLLARVAGHMSPRVGEEVGIAIEGDVIAFRAAGPKH